MSGSDSTARRLEEIAARVDGVVRRQGRESSIEIVDPAFRLNVWPCGTARATPRHRFGGVLRVEPEGVAAFLSKVFDGEVDLANGPSEFDRRFFVHGKPRAWAEGVLSESVQHALLDLRTFGTVSVEVTAERLVLDVAWKKRADPEAGIEAMTEAAKVVTLALSTASLETAAAPLGACVVCARPVKTDAWKCPSCGAIHHGTCSHATRGCAAIRCANRHEHPATTFLEVIERAAGDLDGRVTGAGIVFERDECIAVAEARGQFWVHPVRPFQGTLHVRPFGYLSKLLHFLEQLKGGTDDPEFDECYEVGGGPRYVWEQILVPNVRRRMVRLWSLGVVELTMSPSCLLLKITPSPREKFMSWFPHLAACGAAIAEAAVPARAKMAKGSSRQRARCPICWSPLREDLVVCAICATPHHRECWAFAGRCAIFGCGSLRMKRME